MAYIKYIEINIWKILKFSYITSIVTVSLERIKIKETACIKLALRDAIGGDRWLINLHDNTFLGRHIAWVLASIGVLGRIQWTRGKRAALPFLPSPPGNGRVTAHDRASDTNDRRNAREWKSRGRQSPRNVIESWTRFTSTFQGNQRVASRRQLRLHLAFVAYHISIFEENLYLGC